MLPAPAALVASLALAGVTRYTAGLSATARYYTDVEALQPIETSAIELEPRLGLEHEERASVFRIAYYPHLLMIANSPPPQWLHQASAGLSFQLEPGLRLAGAATGCYGTNDFRVQYSLTCGAAPLGATPGAGPQPIPRATTVEYMSASAAVGLEGRPSARLGYSGTLTYVVQGGANAPTRALLPLQRGPSFLLAVEWTAGRSDSLTTSLSGSYYLFLREIPVPIENPPAQNAWISQAVETWHHQLGRDSRLRLGLGVGVAGNAIDFPRLVLRNTSVVAEAVFLQAFVSGEGREGVRPEGRPGTGLPGWAPLLTLDVGARLAPFVDFTSGLAYNRAEAFAGLGWPLDPDWRLDASLSASRAVDGIQRGQTTATGLLTATWRAERWLRLSTGLSAVWQEAGVAFPASTIRQLAVVVGITGLGGGEL